jgi:hypothetical protein
VYERQEHAGTRAQIARLSNDLHRRIVRQLLTSEGLMLASDDHYGALGCDQQLQAINGSLQERSPTSKAQELLG